MKSIADEAIEDFLKNDPRKEVAFCGSCIIDWFEKDFKKLCFDRIVRKQWNKTPDFIMMKDKKEVKVEIEYLSSGFLKHGHRASEVDAVVCCYEDIDIKDVKVIDLNHIFVAYHKEIFPDIGIMNKQFSPDELRSLVSGWGKRGEKK